MNHFLRLPWSNNIADFPASRVSRTAQRENGSAVTSSLMFPCVVVNAVPFCFLSHSSLVEEFVNSKKQYSQESQDIQHAKKKVFPQIQEKKSCQQVQIENIVVSVESQEIVHGIASVLLWALNATEKKVWRFILSGEKHVHINAATENRRNSTKTPQTSFFMANLRSTSKWFARVIFGFGERYWSLWVKKQSQLHWFCNTSTTDLSCI